MPIDDVVLEETSGVATVTLNRPMARNALTPAMARRLVETLQSLRHSNSARVVVLRAEGADFSVGADLKDLSGGLAADAVIRGHDVAQVARATSVPLATALADLPQPLVAAVRGHAVGIGAQLILSADLVVASATTRILIPQARLAHPVDHGESWYLPRRIGTTRALQALLLAETLDAERAERWGLLNWVVADDALEQKTREIIDRLLGMAPLALREIKALVTNSPDRTLADQLEAEMQALQRCAASSDFPEALAAFVAKRPPRFTGQ